MPPKRRDRADDVLDRDSLRHLEQMMEQIVNQMMDRMIEQLTHRMATFIGNRNRENPNPNPNPNPDQEEFGEKSEGKNYFANKFIEEGPSDDAFFLAGGDGESEFDKDDYDGDDKEANAVWLAIDKMMDSQRKDRKEARLK
ncbi:hypothetical protein CDL15_Pgr003582 [Punica granatum]|uniref:PRP1 splicing factor N-terminal domain-containing protein n=1 Tax=Punica granatum TaxID=22663 RepID=A0A218XTL6_PUNGR|nr:hypothetical protein CDL15_Pgr003582 [Punica granatum]PKI38278.1 hypothetical protein CRG98_041325 [Punica granatum]